MLVPYSYFLKLKHVNKGDTVSNPLNSYPFFSFLRILIVIGRTGNAFSRKGNINYLAGIEKVIEDKLGIQGKIVPFLMKRDSR